MLKARIIGLGSYLPERVLSNNDLEKMVETSDEWIVSRTGIRERRLAGPHQSPSDMGVEAAKRAIKDAGISCEEVDLILVATMTPDYTCPGTAPLIQHRLGATRAAAFDIQAACTGFLCALSMAKAYIEAGLFKRVLVVATEKMSAFIDYKDRNTCVLFGDGAGAAVVGCDLEGLAVDSICLGADGSLAELIIIPGGGAQNPATAETVEKNMHTLKLMGKEVFKHAVRRMSGAVKECLAQAGVSQQQVSWLVPHQANDRIMEALSKSFEIPDDRVYKTVHKYGNTSASSVVIALDELMRGKKLQAGEHLLLVAFGAGLTWGSCLLTKM